MIKKKNLFTIIQKSFCFGYILVWTEWVYLTKLPEWADLTSGQGGVVSVTVTVVWNAIDQVRILDEFVSDQVHAWESHECCFPWTMGK